MSIKCNKCGSNNVTMLFVSYVCNICEPPKSMTAPDKKKLSNDNGVWYYGWISTRDPDPAWMHLKWAKVYATPSEARTNGNYAVRIKSRTPFKRYDLVTHLEHESYITDHGLIKSDGTWCSPIQSGFVGEAFVIACPDNEGFFEGD